MARQAGPLYFTGTIDDLTFYKMEGTYYARKKSSLDRKQFRTDPRFARSRKSAARFGEASKLASEIYHQLPKEQKKKGVIGKLTGQVGRLLREGKRPEEIIIQLLNAMGIKVKMVANSVIDKPARTVLSSWKIAANGHLRVGMMVNLLRQTPAILQDKLVLKGEPGITSPGYLT